jgi:hypothetical protein
VRSISVRAVRCAPPRPTRACGGEGRSGASW